MVIKQSANRPTDIYSTEDPQVSTLTCSMLVACKSKKACQSLYLAQKFVYYIQNINLPLFFYPFINSLLLCLLTFIFTYTNVPEHVQECVLSLFIMFLWSQTYFSIIHNLVLYPVSSKGCHYQKGKKGQSKHLLNTCRFIESTLSRC